MLLSVVIPTYNERETINDVLAALSSELASLVGHYEIIVVDDNSPDGTAMQVEQFAGHNSAVILLSRVASRDLASALAQGFDAAAGEYLLAMDADMQHDPASVLRILAVAQQQDRQLVVATRYACGGTVAQWTFWRHLASRFATGLARQVLSANRVSDPLSGFFLLRRDCWCRLRAGLRPSGFKLLLTLLATEPELRCAEVGYCFAARLRGSSKLDSVAAWVFLCNLWQLYRRRRRAAVSS